ncbi:MAG: TraR/DksA family transcriptional regulator [Nitriliruptorales bacterium]
MSTTADAGLDTGAVSSFKVKLVAERERLVDELGELHETSDLGRWKEDLGADLADAGFAIVEREQAVTLASNAKGLMRKIDAALARMDEGAYGVCEACGEPIGDARLEAIPYATLCVDDQEIRSRMG